MTPHEEEDEAWKSLYHGVRFLDDMNGYKELNKDQVIAARKLEIDLTEKRKSICSSFRGAELTAIFRHAEA